MTLIKVTNKFVAPLHILARLALQYVYNKKAMKPDKIDLLMKSIPAWTKKIGLTESEQEDLQRIGKFLYDDKQGKFEARKELFKKHKINWAKFHRVRDIQELGDAKNID